MLKSRLRYPRSSSRTLRFMLFVESFLVYTCPKTRIIPTNQPEPHPAPEPDRNTRVDKEKKLKEKA